MPSQTFGIVLAVIQFLAVAAITLIYKRFERLELRMDKVDELIFERSEEMATLAEAQKWLVKGQQELITMVKEGSKELREELRTISGLVRYSGSPSRER